MAPAKHVPALGAEEFGRLLVERQAFLLDAAQAPRHARALTHWEELTDIGYNPQTRRLEALVALKQSTGYDGGPGSAGSLECVRFYVDFRDGHGFADLGLVSFRVNDLPSVGEKNLPVSAMVALEIDDSRHRRFIDCQTAIVPRLRVVLSWKSAPPAATPGFVPHYGHAREADIQLLKQNFVQARDVLNLTDAKGLLGIIKPDGPLQLKDPVAPQAAAIFASNRQAGVPDLRTFYSTIGAAMQSSVDFKQAAALYNLKDLPALKVDPVPMLSNYTAGERPPDVSFEEVVGVGLNTATDTLGAIVHVKRAVGYNGDLCHVGSREHVAFWADWNGDGVFEQYLGTMSFEVHDIANFPAGGLFYNVALAVDVSERLRDSDTPNLVRVRAVLSWEALPSTSDANWLNTWGNFVDAVVQLRPGASSGVRATVTQVGGVDRQMIDPEHHLYNYTALAPTPAHNRPWAGSISFHGIIDRNGYNGAIRFRFLFKPFGAPDSDYRPVSTTETFRLWQPSISSSPFPDNQSADPEGWYVYDPNPALGVHDHANNYLSHLQASALAEGAYTIRFEYTDESARVVVADTFSIAICNRGMFVGTTSNRVIDLSRDLDLVIEGNELNSFDHRVASVGGHLRAVHPYFGSWVLTIRSASHTPGIVPLPTTRSYGAPGDEGDAFAAWRVDSASLEACGYTVRLDGYTRVILNSNPGVFPHYGPKAIVFAKLPPRPEA